MEQKSYWSSLLEKINAYVPGFIKTYAPVILQKVLGTSKGLYVWILEKALKAAWKKAYPWIKSKIGIMEQIKAGKKDIEKLEENKTDISLEEKVSNESEFLNNDNK